MKIPAHILLCCLILIGMVSMTSAARFIPANDPSIRYFGRWDFSEPLHPRHSWPGTYITAAFTGTSIGVRMTDSVNYYNVEIDGKFIGVFHGTKSGDADYILAEGLADTVHTLRLAKRNIVFDAVFTFSGLLIGDGASAFVTPVRLPPPVKIEFIGDSFTAGESNEATVQELPWEARFPVTNIDESFAVVIARHYKADYRTICRSGIGMVCDWEGKTDLAMPMFYNRTLMERPLPLWDMKQWTPQLIVIALGLNDYSGLKDPAGIVTEEKTAFFKKGYRDFVATLRSYYPGARILAVSPFPEWLRIHIRQVVDEEKSSGHRDIEFAAYDEFPGGYVAYGHPTVETHRKMAEELIGQIDTLGLVPIQE